MASEISSAAAQSVNGYSLFGGAPEIIIGIYARGDLLTVLQLLAIVHVTFSYSTANGRKGSHARGCQ